MRLLKFVLKANNLMIKMYEFRINSLNNNKLHILVIKS